MLQINNNKLSCLSRLYSQHVTLASEPASSATSASAFVEAVVMTRGTVRTEVVLTHAFVSWETLTTAYLSVVRRIVRVELVAATHVQRVVALVLILTAVVKPVRLKPRLTSSVWTRTSTTTVAIEILANLIVWCLHFLPGSSSRQSLLLRLSWRSLLLLGLLFWPLLACFCICWRLRVLRRTRLSQLLSGLFIALIGVLTSVPALSPLLRLGLVIGVLLSSRLLLG